MTQVLINGIVLSANYALIALGLTLIFSIMDLLNFAHGQIAMIGGFAVYYIYGQWGLPFPVALVAAAIVTGALGYIFESFFFRRVIREATREEQSMLLAVGTALLLENLALSLFGEKQRGVPPVFTGVLRIGDGYFPASRLFVVVVSIALIIALLVFVQYTKPGRAMRALAQNREVTALMGVDVERVRAMGFAIGAALAGLAGGLLITIAAVNSGHGHRNVDQGFHYDHDRRRGRGRGRNSWCHRARLC